MLRNGGTEEKSERVKKGRDKREKRVWKKGGIGEKRE